MNHETYNSRRAAEYIGCSVASLRVWRVNGKGPDYFRAGKLIRYRRRDLDAWIQKHFVRAEGAEHK